MTNQEMLNAVINAGLGIEMTIDTLDRDDDVKQFDPALFFPIIETDDRVLFGYFDDYETYVYYKENKSLSVNPDYYDYAVDFCLIKINFISDDCLEYLSGFDYFVSEYQDGVIIYPSDTDISELEKLGIA